MTTEKMKKISKDAKKILIELVNMDSQSERMHTIQNYYRINDAKSIQLIKELIDAKCILVEMWADGIPYFCELTNTAYDYCSNIEFIVDNSISIGNNNNLTKAKIVSAVGNNEKTTWFERHKIITGIIIAVVAGAILMLPFWEKLMSNIGELL